MVIDTRKTFEDVLDDEFIDVFRPIFCFLTLFGMRGVTFEYKFVTASSVLYKSYCCLVWTIDCISIIDCGVRCKTRFDALSTDLPLKLGTLINGSINTYLAWKIVFRDEITHSQLFVKLQRIERTLKMKDSVKINKKLSKLLTYMGIFTVFMLFVFFLTTNFYMIEGFCPSATIAIAASTSSYFEMSLVIIMLYFISLRAIYVNDMLLKKNTIYLQSEQVYLTSNFGNKEEVPNELVDGACCILDSFADVMDLFQHAILLTTCQMLVWQLISMQNLITSLKTQMSLDIASFLWTLPSSVAYMVLMLVLCLISQSLNNELEECKQLCTKYTLSCCEGKSRANAKRIIILLEGKRDATVYDVFTLDAQLPLHLLAITASYTIILLQFAVLNTE